MIDFTCSCGRHFRVIDDKAGSKGPCPNCGQTVQVPVASVKSPTAQRASPAIPSPQPLAASHPLPTPSIPTRPISAPRQHPAPSQLPPSLIAPTPAGYEATRPAVEGTDFVQGAESDQNEADAVDNPAAEAAAAYRAEHAFDSPLAKHSSRTKNRRNLHSRRTFNLLGTGLLLGFLLPNIVPDGERTRTTFANIEFIGDSSLPTAVRLFSIVPLFASLAIYAAGNMTRGVARGAIIASLGIASFAVLFLDKDLRGLFSYSALSTGLTTAILLLCGIALLLAGILSVRHQPKYRPLGIVAIVGGVMFLASLFIPQGSADSMLITAAFDSGPDVRTLSSRKRDSSPRIFAAAALVVMMAVACYAIFLAAMNQFTRKLGNIALTAAFGSFALLYLALCVQLNHVMGLLLIGSEGKIFVAAAMVATKMCLWYGTLAMVIPVGFSELMLGVAEKQVGTGDTPGFEVQMIAGPRAPAQPVAMMPPPMIAAPPFAPQAFPPAPQPVYPPKPITPPPMQR